MNKQNHLLSLNSPLVAVLSNKGTKLLGTTRAVGVCNGLGCRAVFAVYPVEDGREDLRDTEKRRSPYETEMLMLITMDP